VRHPRPAWFLSCFSFEIGVSSSAPPSLSSHPSVPPDVPSMRTCPPPLSFFSGSVIVLVFAPSFSLLEISSVPVLKLHFVASFYVFLIISSVFSCVGVPQKFISLAYLFTTRAFTPSLCPIIARMLHIPPPPRLTFKPWLSQISLFLILSDFR